MRNTGAEASVTESGRELTAREPRRATATAVAASGNRAQKDAPGDVGVKQTPALAEHPGRVARVGDRLELRWRAALAGMGADPVRQPDRAADGDVGRALAGGVIARPADQDVREAGGDQRDGREPDRQVETDPERPPGSGGLRWLPDRGGAAHNAKSLSVP